MQAQRHDDPEVSINITENYEDGTVYYGCDAYDCDIFIEAVEATEGRIQSGSAPSFVSEGDTYYNVGIFDRTIGSHPTVIGAATNGIRTRERAVQNAIELAANLREYLEAFRSRDDYQAAKSLEDAAADLEDRHGGEIPEHEVAIAQNHVQSGRTAWEDAHDTLREIAIENADTDD